MKEYNIGNFAKYRHVLNKNFTRLLLYNRLPVSVVMINRYFVALFRLLSEINHFHNIPTMQIPAGTLLLSASTDEADIFERAVILLVEQNANGHTGFIINKQLPRKLNKLVEFRNSKPFPLYEGGPVDKEHLFFIHRRPDLIAGGAFINDNFFLGGDFTQAIQCIDQGLLGENDIKLFIGYCGWDVHQLEEEIAQGEWKTNYSSLEKILSEDTSMLWYTLL